MFDIKDKKVLITGASGGIGESLAQKFHEMGAMVLLHGTRKEKLEEIAKGLKNNVEIITADLTKPDEVETLAKDSMERMGEINVLINNAGVTRDGLFVRMSQEDWDTVIQVNLTATFQLCKALAYPMMRQRSGRIVNITSVVGVMGNPGQANYCASKAGMIGMTKSLAMEIASRGVTVNCIAPGFIESPMTDALNEKQKETILNNVPMGSLGTGDDVANCAVYLASPEARYITGQTIHINGGMVMI